MAEWKPFDLKWGRSIWYCSACEESTEVPTYLGTPMYNFCPMCGANMNMKSENKEVDTSQSERIKTPDYCDICNHKGCNKCTANNLDDYCVPSGYAPKDTPQTDCNGCKFVGWYDTDFPCVNCVRKNKDYYTAEQTEERSE